MRSTYSANRLEPVNLGCQPWCMSTTAYDMVGSKMARLARRGPSHPVRVYEVLAAEGRDEMQRTCIHPCVATLTLHVHDIERGSLLTTVNIAAVIRHPWETFSPIIKGWRLRTVA